MNQEEADQDVADEVSHNISHNISVLGRHFFLVFSRCVDRMSHAGRCVQPLTPQLVINT